MKHAVKSMHMLKQVYMSPGISSCHEKNIRNCTHILKLGMRVPTCHRAIVKGISGHKLEKRVQTGQRLGVHSYSGQNSAKVVDGSFPSRHCKIHLGKQLEDGRHQI